ncbi:hypothetical protein LQW54_013042 [Pestalotiopsis sp. IQ-011]
MRDEREASPKTAREEETDAPGLHEPQIPGGAPRDRETDNTGEIAIDEKIGQGRKRLGDEGHRVTIGESAESDQIGISQGDIENEDQGKEVVRRSGPLPSQADSFAIEKGEEPPQEKEKPNYGTSGTLAAASNSIAQADGSTIVLKYHEPPEARKPSPKDQWKLFVFKGQDIIDTIELNARTCWLIGREMAVIDIAAEHPSISKQHAVVQFRFLEKRNEYGDKIGKVKPYLIDLESANGTMLNSKKIPDSRYLELKDKDLIQFGQSTREYVIMLAPKD